MIKSKLKNRNISQEDVFNLSELFKLMKPRVMSLVIFTCAVGLLMAPNIIPSKDAIIGIILVSIGAGAAGALNMWWDSDIDFIMSRTSSRPIPEGRITDSQALSFGIFLTFFSVMLLGLFANYLSASLLAGTIFFYVVVYTIFLKRKTPQNIVIGGAAGALPPVIGWAVATNSVGLESILMFALIFFWTPPHFWALCLMTKNDYLKSGIPMLTETHGETTTRKYIFIYSVILLIPSALISFTSIGGIIYLLSIIPLNVIFFYLVISLYRNDRNDKTLKEKRERQLFLYSIFFLFAHFLVLLLEYFTKFFIPMYSQITEGLIWF